jgi:hypothetical protein
MIMTILTPLQTMVSLTYIPVALSIYVFSLFNLWFFLPTKDHYMACCQVA